MKAAQIFFFIGLIALVPRVDAQHRIEKHDLTTISGWMSGVFSSEAQAKKDSGFFNISLKIRPIWRSLKMDHWLYVEQAMYLSLDKPYRQRVFHLYPQGDSVLLITVYELPGQSRFIGAAEQPEMIDKIGPDSLILRKGCSIYIHKTGPETYSGTTLGKDCHSSLRGARYSTLKADISRHEIISWDQGFDANDKQVWGATRGGYRFVKIQEW